MFQRSSSVAVVVVYSGVLPESPCQRLVLDGYEFSMAELLKCCGTIPCTLLSQDGGQFLTWSHNNFSLWDISKNSVWHHFHKLFSRSTLGTFDANGEKSEEKWETVDSISFAWRGFSTGAQNWQPAVLLHCVLHKVPVSPSKDAAAFLQRWEVFFFYVSKVPLVCFAAKTLQTQAAWKVEINHGRASVSPDGELCYESQFNCVHKSTRGLKLRHLSDFL